jgi:ATP-dependent HslUV protease subunit HslV
MAGDGQVSLGKTVIKGNARKVRRIGKGGTSSRLRRRHRRRLHPARTPGSQARAAIPNQLERACVELAKDWRTDRYLRRLEAMMRWPTSTRDAGT